MTTWKRYSTQRRYSHLSKRDEVVAVEFGRGVCSYGDGPMHRIGLACCDLPEAKFLAVVETVLAALNAPKDNAESPIVEAFTAE